MKSIDEKLEYFDRIILKEAALRRDNVLKQIRDEKEAVINQERLALQKQADDQLKVQLQQIENESYDIISKAFVESRQLLGKTRENIMKEIMSELRQRLEKFVAGPDYPGYLEECIQNACRQAGEGDLLVQISKLDLDKNQQLLEKLKTQLGIVYEEAEDDIIGGCRVFNKSANFLIDNSIASRMRQAEENFLQTSNLSIE